MVLVVAGRFDQEKVSQLAQKWFTLSPRTVNPTSRHPDIPTSDHPNINPSHSPTLKLQYKKTEQAHLVLGVRGNPLGHPDRFAEGLLATVLGAGMSSRLFTEIREKRGLAYYVRTEIEH